MSIQILHASGTLTIPGATINEDLDQVSVHNNYTQFFGTTGLSEVRGGAGARGLTLSHYLTNAYADYDSLFTGLLALDQAVNLHGNVIAYFPAITVPYFHCTYLGYRKLMKPIPDWAGQITGAVGRWMVHLAIDFVQLRPGDEDDFFFGG